MKLIRPIERWLQNISKYCITGFFPRNRKNMTGRKLEDDTEDTPNKKLCVEKEKVITPRIKKRHVALLLSYSGINYYGMQINSGFKTIEAELLQALSKSNMIPEQAVSSPHLISFQRAARTDKSVSAAKQVVSFLIADNFCVSTINEHLPEDVRVFSIVRVTKGFSSKNFCCARTYSYTLPTFALAPELHEEFPQNYRTNQDIIQRVNDFLHSYEGSNMYHNFTSKKNHDDPSARRYILSFTSGTPFIENGEEFITLTIKGQSFMLHQIRKMVGHMIAVLKGIASEDINKSIWNAKKFVVPLAPGLGLVLEDVHYDKYNRKYGSDGIHKPLEWEDLADKLNEFKRKYILSNIIKREIEEKLMFNWILQLKDHSYMPEDYNQENVVRDVKKN